MNVLLTQSCLTLCDPMGCSPPGSSVRRVLQTRILEWVAVSSSSGFSPPRDRTWVSCIGRLPSEPPGKKKEDLLSLSPPFPVIREKFYVMLFEAQTLTLGSKVLLSLVANGSE